MVVEGLFKPASRGLAVTSDGLAEMSAYFRRSSDLSDFYYFHWQLKYLVA